MTLTIIICINYKVKVQVAQSCVTFCDCMDFTVYGSLQARILEWVAFPSPGDFPNPGMEPRSPAVQVNSLPAEPQGKSRITEEGSLSLLWDLPHPGIQPGSPTLQANSLPMSY